jgi:tRNA threonylcarbamoyl adenosine modification protein (Sua5/YciO/YrdC/YwlC family)
MLLVKDLSNQELIAALKRGAVGVLPTDTIYGLVCRAGDKQAVARLYEAKPREAKPGTVIAADIDQLVELGILARYLKPVAYFWPGPISVVVPTQPGLEYLDRGLMSLAVRIPALDGLRALLAQTGPLLTTSANLTGQPPAKSLEAARACFGDKVDFYVDGGEMTDKPPSTIIRVVDDEIEVLRQGAVRISDTGEIS